MPSICPDALIVWVGRVEVQMMEARGWKLVRQLGLAPSGEDQAKSRLNAMLNCESCAD